MESTASSALLNTTLTTSEGSSNIQGVNLDHTSHSEMEIAHPEGQILHEVITIPDVSAGITEGSSAFDMQRINNPSNGTSLHYVTSEIPANEISMMSVMSAFSEPSNDPEISMISINEISKMSVCSEPSNDPQIAMMSIFKNLQKIKKILLEKKALKDLQVTPV